MHAFGGARVRSWLAGARNCKRARSNRLAARWQATTSRLYDETQLVNGSPCRSHRQVRLAHVSGSFRRSSAVAHQHVEGVGLRLIFVLATVQADADSASPEWTTARLHTMLAEPGPEGGWGLICGGRVAHAPRGHSRIADPIEFDDSITVITSCTKGGCGAV